MNGIMPDEALGDLRGGGEDLLVARALLAEPEELREPVLDKATLVGVEKDLVERRLELREP